MNALIPHQRVQVRTIIKVVCEHYGVSETEVLSSRRPTLTSEARHVSMWLAMKLTDLPSTSIGRLLGKDETTVRHGVQKVDRRIEAEPDFRTTVETLRHAALAAEQCFARLSILGIDDPSLDETALRIVAKGPTAVSSVEIMRLARAHLADRTEGQVTGLIEAGNWLVAATRRLATSTTPDEQATARADQKAAYRALIAHLRTFETDHATEESSDGR
ncbi:helix-turn-helix domain-containing protein [Amorphus coralli]|uniref:helix-turn-helix domain-containing protein n=1 Tax=Amorphus coralli TaxID=340680 RepID=UPI0003645CE7|nr:helix-turn-helix domain-containing protein [Amorphus coralli]